MRVLIIAEYFAPVQAIASIRWTKLAKYLVSERGFTVDLVTTEKDYDGEKPWLSRASFDSLLAEDFDSIHHAYYLNTPLFARFARLLMAGGKGLRRIISNRMAKRQQEGQSKSSAPNSQGGGAADYSLIQRVRFHFLDIVDKSLGHSSYPPGFDPCSYDVIISTFGPKWPHYYARRIKQENPELVWLADFRDPVASNISYGDSIVNRRFASEVTGKADCILGVDREQAVRECLYLEPNQRCESVPNGFDLADRAYVRACRKDKFVISYTGTLYREGPAISDLTPLFQALRSLGREGVINLSEVLFVYAGLSGDYFDEVASSFGEIAVENRGLIPRSDALKLQQESALLTLLTWNSSAVGSAVTGKVFELLMSHVPIVGVCSGDLRGSIVKEIVESAGAGYCYEEAGCDEDMDHMKRFIVEKYLQWQTSGSTDSHFMNDYIEQYSYQARADQLGELIDELAGEERVLDES